MGIHSWKNLRDALNCALREKFILSELAEEIFSDIDPEIR